MRLLEGEVQRLSQTVLDLQSVLSGLTTSLRTDLQEDTKKMLETLLSNMRPPDTPTATDTEESPAVLDGHQATRGGIAGEKAIEKIVARLDDINNALKTKDEALEDIRGTMSSHEGQIRVLMDASQSQAPGMAEFDVIQTYIDGKLEKLKKELDQNVEEHMAKLQSSYNDKIQTLQNTCENSCDQGLIKLSKIVDSKEADLRKEIRSLRLDMAAADGPVRIQRQTDPSKEEDEPSNHKDLWREINRIAEAHRILNARIDNELANLSAPQEDRDFNLIVEELEARMNVTEQNAETHCFYIEEKLTRAIAEEAAARSERLNSMEDQFTNMLVEMSNNSFPGMFGDSIDALQSQVNNNKYLLEGLDHKVNAVGELCSAGCSASGISTGAEAPSSAFKGLDNILKDLSRYRNELDVLNTDVNTNKDKLKQLENLLSRQSDGIESSSKTMGDFQKGLINLQDNVLGLASAVTGLGDSLGKYNQDIYRINSTCCQNERSVTWNPVPGGQPSASSREVEELKNRLDTLSRQVSSDLSQCKQNAQGVSTVDGRVTRLEKVCGRLDGISINIKELKEGLERHVGGLRECVNKMNVTCGNYGADIINMQNSLQRFQAQLSAMAKHVSKDVTAKEPGELVIVT